MNIHLLLIILITFLLIFVINDVSSDHALCWDLIPEPNNLSHKIQRPCPMVKNRKRAASTAAPANNSDMFTVSFSCSVEDENPELCRKVKNAFYTAGQIISSSIKLNTPLIVNASLVNFCTTRGICLDEQTGRLTLGGAGPSRLIPIEKDQRVYPQSILKQLNKENHPEYSPFDINALFNSEGNYWFEEDGPIKPNQSDFLFVILHELIHGLGFCSGWDDHSDMLGIQNIITPTPIFLTTPTGQVIFGGFREFIFDKFMVLLSDGTHISNLTEELNKFSGVGTAHNSMDDFLNYFMTTFPSSPEYNIAQKMMNISTTPKSLGILPLNKTDIKDAFILETSLSPFLSKSSISHCDYITYAKSPDFLMRFLQDPGISLKRSIRLGGNYANGPIGPKLSQTLSSIGYQIQNLPNTFKPNPNEIVVDDEINIASSLKAFNLNYLIIKFLFFYYIMMDFL